MHENETQRMTWKTWVLALLLLVVLAVPAYATEEPQIFQVTEEDLTDLQVNLGEEGEVSLSDATQAEWERMQQEIAGNLEKRLSSFTITTTLPYTSNTQEEKDILSKLYFNTLYNYPEQTYFVRTSIGYYSGNSGGKLYFTFYPEYLSLDAAAYKAAVDEAYAACISEGMTDLEKVVSAHDWLVANCQYDPYVGSGNKQYVASDGTVYNEDPLVYTSYGAFVNRNVVCQGYALAFKVLMDRAGIPCSYVRSDAINHAWDMVQLGGKWYHVDATWDDPIYAGTADWAGRIKRENLLCSDTEITNTGHRGWSTEWGYTCETSYPSTAWKDAGDCPITYDPEQNAFLFYVESSYYNSDLLYWCPVGTDFAAEKRVEILGNLSTAYAAAYDTKADIFYYAEYGGDVYEVDLTAAVPSAQLLREGDEKTGLILRESTQVPGAMELCGRYAYATTWTLLVGMDGTDETMPVQIRYPGTLDRVDQLSGMGLEIRPSQGQTESCTVYLACYDRSGRMLGVCALGNVPASQTGESTILKIPAGQVPSGTTGAKILAVSGGGVAMAGQLTVGDAA